MSFQIVWVSKGKEFRLKLVNVILISFIAVEIYHDLTEDNAVIL